MSAFSERTESAAAKVPDFDAAVALELYRNMQLVRAVELAIESMHKRGTMSGSFHSSMGQEAARSAYAPRSSTRTWSPARTAGTATPSPRACRSRGIFAELFGRSTGVSGGRGGSMHLHHRESGFLGENAIVGGGLPWAAGAAWARKRLGKPGQRSPSPATAGPRRGSSTRCCCSRVSGAALASVVCENNGLAHSMPSERLWGAPGTIARMVEATGVESRAVDGRDVLAVHAVARSCSATCARGARRSWSASSSACAHTASLTRTTATGRATPARMWMKTNDPIENLRRALAPAADRSARADRRRGRRGGRGCACDRGGGRA